MRYEDYTLEVKGENINLSRPTFWFSQTTQQNFLDFLNKTKGEKIGIGLIRPLLEA